MEIFTAVLIKMTQTNNLSILKISIDWVLTVLKADRQNLVLFKGIGGIEKLAMVLEKLIKGEVENDTENILVETLVHVGSYLTIGFGKHECFEFPVLLGQIITRNIDGISNEKLEIMLK
jgi:hypothetical protein